MSMPYSSSESESSPEEILAALRAGGPALLAELLGDVDFLLAEVAASPKKMFETRHRTRTVYKNVLDMTHQVRSALDALESQTVVALAEATRRDHVQAAHHDDAHEDDLLPPLEQMIRQADSTTVRDVSFATRRAPSTAKSTLTSARRLVGSMPRMLTALTRGEVTAAVAHAAASATAPLDDLQRRQVDEMLHEQMPRMDGAGVNRWRKAVAHAIHELDPHGATDRHQRARTKRHVSFTPGGARHGHRECSPARSRREARPQTPLPRGRATAGRRRAGRSRCADGRRFRRHPARTGRRDGAGDPRPRSDDHRPCPAQP